MSSSSAVRVTRFLLICLALSSTSLGCSGDEAPAPAPATTGSPAPGVTIPNIPPPPSTAGTTTSTGGSSTNRVVDQTPLATTMTLEFLERQLYHAASRNRVIRDIRDTDETHRFTGTDFRVGLILSARNDSDHLLDTPRVISDVVVRGAHGNVKCRTEVNRYGQPVVGVVSPNVDPRTAWGDESRSFLEGPWRPGETIRIAVGLECGPVHLHDIGIQELSGSVRVVARALFVRSEEPCPLPNHYVCDNDVVGTSAALELPARAIVLQQVQLPTGQSGYSAGDLFIRSDAGRVLHENLGTYGASAFTVTGTDLPAQPQYGRETVEEWSMTLTGATVQHWSEVPGTPKGRRIVTVTANLALDAGAIERRLAAASDPETAAGQVAGERSRLAGLLACDSVELITQSRRIRATNGRDTKTVCTSLATQNSAQVTWTFSAERYEIPLGITYSVSRTPHTSFFANATLSTFDPS